ncbi:ABC transporter substrate-binding protein [Solimonas soli]|uniref:ABC transporter substrate-binding protein n=1 Tax=Solimonas soli TaxID=413479 RepID=UPI0004875591|nr:ABC transporter substrate-binding protein [Solimonas soli]
MRNLIRPFLVAAAALLLPLAVQAEPQPQTIRFGEVGGSNVKSEGGKPQGTGLVALAEYLHLFEKEFGPNGPKIEEVFFSGTGPAQNEALAQGAIDFGTYGGVPNVIGLANRIPAHIVATRRSSGTGNYYLGVRADSPYRTLADLKGKRIAVQKGTNPHQTLVLLIESNGLRDDDFKITNLQGNEAVVALNAGAVDAVFGGVNLLILRDRQQLRLVGGTRDFQQAPSQSGVLVADAFASKYPDTVARVVKVLTDVSHWASEESHREALLQFLAARSIGYQYVKEDYEGSLRERFNPLLDESSVAAYVEIVKFAVSHQLIRKAPDEATVRSWFAPQYQQAALQQLQLADYWPKSGALLQVAKR